MRRVIVGILLCLLPALAEARPSFRSIREGVERYEEELKANRYHTTYADESVGLSLQYPKSWLAPEDDAKTGSKGQRYTLWQIIPHDRDYEVGSRRNRILELSFEVWPLGQTFTSAKLDQFARSESAHRYREYFARDAKETTVDGHLAWSYFVNSMTGEREEIWVNANGYVYVFGYRSLHDFFGKDYFFYEDMLASVELKRPRDQEAESSDGDVSGDSDSLKPLSSQALGLFSDVPDTHPYFEAIAWAVEQGIVQGYSDGTFQPERFVNRAELLKIVFAALPALLDLPELSPTGFADVDEAAWYGAYLRIAKFLGIVGGYADNTFRPGQTVNAAEALKIAYEAFGIQTEETEGPWYQQYLSHALKNDILFDPALPMESGMTRQDVVWLVWRLSK